MTGSSAPRELALVLAACLMVACGAPPRSPTPQRNRGDLRLFILAGQSNMKRLNPARTFTPALERAFPGDRVVVVKGARSGRPIRRWYKPWTPPAGIVVPDDAARGDLYDALLTKVKAALAGRRPRSIVFVWMHGERDAKTGLAASYERGLRGLIRQLRDDLGRPDIRVVIGRLSDFGTGKLKTQWEQIRDIQVNVAREDPRAGWIDTDDLNGDDDGLHYTPAGYDTLGERFAEEAVELLGGE